MEQNYTKMEAEIASQKQMINFLKKENAHLKSENSCLSQKISEISTEYADKIAELNRVISGYESARKSLDTIRADYEKKVQALLKDMRKNADKIRI